MGMEKLTGRGHKGFKARSGSGVKPGFEGGQMPLQRRIPKRGFTNTFKRQYALVSLSQLDSFDVGASVTVEALVAMGMVKKGFAVKVLANGELTKALTVTVDKVSESAKAKIESAGGTVITESSVAA